MLKRYRNKDPTGQTYLKGPFNKRWLAGNEMCQMWFGEMAGSTAVVEMHHNNGINNDNRLGKPANALPELP